MAVTETGHLASREIDDLYRAHGAEVYRYAFAVLGNHADAEDVTQTTFLNAYRSLEGGVRPRKPSNWLLTIASNTIKQRFRQEQARPRQVELDERIAHSPTSDDDDEGPSVGELLTALSKIPPQQRQAIVLREFEGRSYVEIAEILGVTTSALETLLFRARRSLAEELEHQLSCTDAQLAVSRSVDGRLGRKERRRLRDHLGECPDCARFARLQQRHSSALRGLALVPIPVSLAMFKGLEGTASAAVVPIGAAGAGAGAVAVGAGVGTTGAAGASGGVLAGGLGLKAAAVVAAAGIAGGVGVAGSTEVDAKPRKSKTPAAQIERGERLGQIAPRGVSVPGNGVARGKPSAPGQAKLASKKAATQASVQKAKTKKTTNSARGQTVSSEKQRAAAAKRAARSERQTRAQRATERAQRSAPASSKAQREPKPTATTPAQTAPAAQTPQTDPATAATEPTAPEPSPGSGNSNGNANAGPKPK
ncbi:MAG TPA: sigma-70 family RNA polymerase sigma factor [Gaiellaceae bacterium]|nr:sigma-70 family RNA polymerase sigma factor [Gaiellaceae bacterium]